MARVLMTGGTGFISSKVAARLARKGHDVHLFHRGKTRADLPRSVSHHYGDRTVPGEMTAVMDIVHPEFFVDMNAYTREEASRAASAAVQADVGAVIVISSGDVYRQCDGLTGRAEDPPTGGLLDEDAPLRESRYPYRATADSSEKRLYDYDKLLVEEAYRDAELPATILRLPKVFGPGDFDCFSDYMRPMRRKLPVLSLSRRRAAWRWSRGDVASVAEAIAETIERPVAGVYNLAPEQCPTELDWIHILGGLMGWNGRLSEPSLSQSDEYDWRYDIVLDGSRFRQIWTTRVLEQPYAAVADALGLPIAPIPARQRSPQGQRRGLR